MSAPIWKCQFQEVPGTDLTVGRVLHLQCSGEAVEFKAENLKLIAVGQQDHTLQLVKITNLSSTSADLEVVSYRVGEHKDVSLALTDGTQYVTVEPVTWQVRTVIDPQSAQNIEPFGAFGPWKISWPWWYWIILFICILAVVMVGFFQFRRFKIYRKLKKEVDEYKERFDPFEQLQKALRSQQRRLDATVLTSSEIKSVPILELFSECQKSFILFLKVEFIVPDGSANSRILRKVKKKLPKAPEKIFKDLRLLLEEFNRHKKSDLKPSDIEHIIRWAQNLSEELNEELEAS